jgi:hypothetical protein
MSAKDLVGEVVKEVLTNPKVGVLVAGATTGSGVGTWLDVIPDDIGKLATLVGIGLSLVLMAAWSVSFRKTLLEMRIMRRKEAERLENIAALRRRETD